MLSEGSTLSVVATYSTLVVRSTSVLSSPTSSLNVSSPTEYCGGFSEVPEIVGSIEVDAVVAVVVLMVTMLGADVKVSKSFTAVRFVSGRSGTPETVVVLGVAFDVEDIDSGVLVVSFSSVGHS